jgi:hypothetical protein
MNPAKPPPIFQPVIAHAVVQIRRIGSRASTTPAEVAKPRPDLPLSQIDQL